MVKKHFNCAQLNCGPLSPTVYFLDKGSLYPQSGHLDGIIKLSFRDDFTVEEEVLQ